MDKTAPFGATNAGNDGCNPVLEMQSSENYNNMKYQDLFEKMAYEVGLRSGHIPSTPRDHKALWEAVLYANVTYFNQEADPNSRDGVRHRIFICKSISYYLQNAVAKSPFEVSELRTQEYREVLNLQALIKKFDINQL